VVSAGHDQRWNWRQRPWVAMAMLVAPCALTKVDDVLSNVLTLRTKKGMACMALTGSLVCQNVEDGRVRAGQNPWLEIKGGSMA